MKTNTLAQCPCTVVRGGKRYTCTRPTHVDEWHTIYTKRHGYLFVNAQGQRRDDLEAGIVARGTISDAQIEKLGADLRAAKPIVAKSVRRVKDGGSFSSDTVWIDIGRKPHPTRFKRLEASIEAAGFDFYWSDSQKGLLVSPDVAGQCSRRLAACETLAETLKAAGWDAGVFYRMG